MPVEVRLLTVGGRVQGVGFRPFVYRLAHVLGVRGWVRNTTAGVQILVSAPRSAIEEFATRLISDAPPLARPALLDDHPARIAAPDDFRILSSEAAGGRDAHLPPDHFACPDCVRELRDPADRRYRYPFINCTQCGPRYTIIDGLPYDRARTSMSGFALCQDCRREYEDPLDRRFHAEPIACPQCGPSLVFVDKNRRSTGSERALAAAVHTLRRGGIVAVRGIGGYHLMCDACSESAVAELRRRKGRPDKPLAVMAPEDGADGCDAVRRCADPGPAELAALRDARRAIVLCRARCESPLAPSIAPGLTEVGIFLPYSPLHYLLLEDFGGPLVATSGNVSGEPVLTEPAEAERRLGGVADAFLHHDRPIRRPADDAVWRTVADAPRPLRLGRGTAPLELELAAPLAEPTLAVGGHMKNTVALGWGRRAVVSPHIGDLDSPRGLAVFAQVIDDLQRLYGVTARRMVCDAHAGYASTRWAARQGVPLERVFHHRAHAAALAAELGIDEPMLVFTWDGTGYGEDGNLWGGEGLVGTPGEWRRASSFRQMRLPGGDRAGREPWRAAAAFAWALGEQPRFVPEDGGLVRTAWQRGVNCPQTSAVGRLFDAAASLLGLCHSASYEGEGPMRLEAAASIVDEAEPLAIARDSEGIWRVDWAGLWPMLRDETAAVAERAGRFHVTLAAALARTAALVAEEHGVRHVGLSGGVFQNRLLTEQVIEALARHGLEALLAVEVPCNDGGISLGQLAEVAAKDRLAESPRA